jgi:hypothetical protein
MSSRITFLNELYGKYNEILPEEIVENKNGGNFTSNSITRKNKVITKAVGITCYQMRTLKRL